MGNPLDDWKPVVLAEEIEVKKGIEIETNSFLFDSDNESEQKDFVYNVDLDEK